MQGPELSPRCRPAAKSGRELRFLHTGQGDRPFGASIFPHSVFLVKGKIENAKLFFLSDARPATAGIGATIFPFGSPLRS